MKRISLRKSFLSALLLSSSGGGVRIEVFKNIDLLRRTNQLPWSEFKYISTCRFSIYMKEKWKGHIFFSNQHWVLLSKFQTILRYLASFVHFRIDLNLSDCFNNQLISSMCVCGCFLILYPRYWKFYDWS